MKNQQTITTTLPKELYHKIKAENLKMSALIIKGYQAAHDFPEITKRLGEFEEKLSYIRKEVERTNRDLLDLRGRVK